MRSIRILNGYRVIYKPDYPKAMKSDNWEGYVYEHIYEAEKHLGRPLRKTEIVHHLDGNRANNRKENLLVLEHSQHRKLHAWLDKGAPVCESYEENRVNLAKAKSIESKLTEPKFCPICLNILNQDLTYCSRECYITSRQRPGKPTKEQLQKDILEMSMTAVGKKYGVSDNAVRKWARGYGIEIDRLTLSQAKRTRSEGSETTGVVKPT